MGRATQTRTESLLAVRFLCLRSMTLPILRTMIISKSVPCSGLAQLGRLFFALLICRMLDGRPPSFQALAEQPSSRMDVQPATLFVQPVRSFAPGDQSLAATEHLRHVCAPLSRCDPPHAQHHHLLLPGLCLWVRAEE